jgi:hypothetical protein
MATQSIRNVANLRAISNLKAAGADLTGATDSTALIEELIAKGNRLYLPEGTISCNATILDKLIIEGDGSNSSFIKPHNTAVAAFSYRVAAPYWTYHSTVRDLAFKGTGKVGVGFTFGRTNPNDFVAGDQYFNNVKFHSVFFTGLNKGIQFPAGNIGTEFYSCGAQGNFYGYYLLDNKFGGDIMHAGNKYWYAGEMSGNDCAIYLSDNTNGFGGIALTDTIIEYNKIAFFTNVTNFQFLPFELRNVWMEGNGQTLGASAETVTVDLWTGSVRTTQNLVKRTFYIDGGQNRWNISGGIFTDANVAATEASVYCFSTTVEEKPAYGGGPVEINTGNVIFDSCFSEGGFPIVTDVNCVGFTRTPPDPIDNSASNASRRAFLAPARRSINTELPSDSVAATLRQAVTLTGSMSVVGSVVADGQLFTSCNEFTDTYDPGEYTKVPGTDVTSAAAGWYAITFDARVLAGSPRFYVWDQNLNQVAVAMPTVNQLRWATYAVIAYAGGAGVNFWLDVGNPAVSGTCTFRLSAYQCRRFDSQLEAQTYIESKAYTYAGVRKGTTTYDPPNLADGAGTTTTVTVTGAVLGNRVEATFSLDTQGITVTAWVSGANTVSVRFQNETHGTIDLASGTLAAWVYSET